MWGCTEESLECLHVGKDAAISAITLPITLPSPIVKATPTTCLSLYQRMAKSATTSAYH
ncbi:hypothetical protein Plhal304r1_c030g0099201 [Plasmopara halstedii]